ncbi:MAG: hypothetical protein WAV04_01155 [Candidatus Microsaccharimonas sp.]
MAHTNKPGYYHLWITATDDQYFFRSALDKAYFLTLLQDALSPRRRLSNLSSIADILAIEVSLLAYSLTDSSVHLLLYTMRRTAIDELGQRLLTHYVEYINQYHTHPKVPFDTLFIFDRLTGPHAALGVSREIHMLHDDWRHDRYSSIGFYLDDRRGDWLSLWRLTPLYDNNPEFYLEYLKSPETETNKLFEFIQT